MNPVTVAGVDLGASGGRVIAARVSADGVELHEVSRFPNDPVLAGGTLHWDILRLHANVVSGLRAASAAFPLAGAGIDSWGCDYGLLDGSGALIGNPVHYRDRRTDGISVPVPPGDGRSQGAGHDGSILSQILRISCGSSPPRAQRTRRA